MAVMTAPNAELTPADVLDLSDSVRYELVDGRLVELELGFLSQCVAAQIIHLLRSFCSQAGMAYVATEAGYICFPEHPDRMRRPDVSCVLRARLPIGHMDDSFLSIRPDLAVEVVSPNDPVYQLEEKLADYRSAGIPVVWLVYPPSRSVRVLRPGVPPVELGPDDFLTCEEILPGFRSPVAELFADTPGTTPVAGV